MPKRTHTALLCQLLQVLYVDMAVCMLDTPSNAVNKESMSRGGEAPNLDVAQHTQHSRPGFFDAEGVQVHGLGLPFLLRPGQVVTELQQELTHLQRHMLLLVEAGRTGCRASGMMLNQFNAFNPDE